MLSGLHFHFFQVKYCPLCQKTNKKVTMERPELYPVPVKSPWYHLGMDFVGPISPISSSGNRYILTVSDYFTKFAWAKALPTKEAINVVSSLREVIISAYTCTYHVLILMWAWFGM